MLGAIACVWTSLPGASLAGWPRVIAEGAAGHFVAASAFILQALLGAQVLSSLGWGRGVDTRPSAPFDSALERFLFSWVIGFVLITLAAMLLAQAGLLGGWSVAAGAGAIALLAAQGRGAARSLRILAACRGRTAAARWLAGWKQAPGQRAAGIAGAIALLAGALYWSWPLLVQTLLPNSDWDSAVYHLPMATRQLDGILWNRDPLFSNYSFPGSASLLYACFLALGFESAIIPYNFLATLLTLGAVYRLAARLGGGTAGVWGVLLLASTHIFWQLGVDPRIDGLLSLFIAAGFLALAGWLDEREEPAFLFLLALCLNAALGTKYTAIFFAAGMSAVAFLALWLPPTPRRDGARARRRILLLYLALLLVPNGVWYASNVVLHGDPLFPMLRGDYYRDTRDPTARLPMLNALAPHLETLPDDSAIAKATRVLESHSSDSVRHNLFDLADMLVHPDEYAVKPNHFTNPLLLAFLFLPFAARIRGLRAAARPFAARIRLRHGAARIRGPDDHESQGRLAVLGVYALGLAFFVGLASQTNLLRYALPVLPALAAGGGVVIASIGHVAWRSAWIVAFAALLLHNHRAEVGKLRLLEPGVYAVHDADRLPWLQGVGYNFAARGMPIVTERINREIADGRMSSDDLVLMVGEGKGRLLDCGSMPDSSWFRQRWLVELLRADFDHDTVLRSLRAQGVTHILYNRAFYNWVIANTTTPRSTLAVGGAHLERFLRQRGERVFRLAGMELVSIQRRP
ncbi:MAG: glycosyltransferase family 39 protein [Deltaproteobacteria bacterium]|nr:glycosyltransferase family 39 protein [Deltaproteobacteria bacterium]MBW2420634.1 glycosyltransferase family 39 protein [Deltaproteobacteria bacterium]